MSRSRAAAAALGLGLLVGGPAASRMVPPGPEPVGGAATLRPAPVPQAIDPFWLALGEQARQHGFSAARELATPRLAEAGTRTVLGLLAHAHEETGLALELLEGGAPAALLDDWRLYVLADVAAARRRPERASEALGELLARHPDSPLRSDAIVRLAELAWESGDAAAALDRIARGRRERLPRGREVALEQLAFRIATARRDAAALREAARRLLVIDPLTASKMRVVDLVAARGGGSDWRLWLSSDELVARAAALLDSDLPAGALTTLAAVPPGERDLDWRLLEARALTASNRGPEAFATLAGATGPAAEAVRLDFERARAARAAGDAARNPAVSAEVRQHWQRVERERLLAVVRATGSGDELHLPALRRLAAAYLEQGRRDEATAALRQLLAADPTDSTGARPLWEAGWQEYLAGRLEAAIAIWRGQAGLYPKSPWTRSGMYWTARAHDRRRDVETARRAYLEIVASSTADFYARQAALRLAGATATSTPAPAPEPWPEDRALARVRLLTDLGLDGPARTELELLAPRGERRAGAQRRHARQSARAQARLPAARHGAAGERAARGAGALLPARLPGHGHGRGGRQRHPGAAGLRHDPPGERLRRGGDESRRRPRPDAADAGDRTGGRRPARPPLVDQPAQRPRVQRPPRHPLLPQHAGAVRRQRRARARRLQRRTGAHLASVAGRGSERRTRSLPRRAGARGVPQLRQAHPRAGRQLPESLSRPRLKLSRRTGGPHGPGACGPPSPLPGP